MATLQERTLATLDGMLPARWPHGNPVDMAGLDTMGESLVLNCLTALVEDEGVDAVLSLVALHRLAPMMPGAPYTSPQRGNTDARAESLKSLSDRAKRLGRPVLSVGALPPVGGEKPPGDASLEGFSVYPSPQRAARVLRHLLWYRRYLDASRSRIQD